MSLFRPSESRALTPSDIPWNVDAGPASMSTDRALSVVPVYAATKLIAETAATLPLHAYTRSAEGRRRSALPPAVGGVAWKMQGFMSALLLGNAVGVLSGMGANGWPSSCTWVHPDRVRVDDSGVAPEWFIDGRPVDANMILHVPAVVMPGKTLGLSPVRAFALTFDSGHEAQSASRQWSRNRAVPGITLQNTEATMTPTQADAMAARAKEKIRTGEPFVSGKDWKLDVLTIPAGDAAFLESIKATANQVASIFSIPPEMIGGESGGSLTYNTVEQQAIQFLTYTIRPWLVRFEEALSARLMPRPQYVQFAVDGLIRVDTEARYRIHKIAREIGLRNVDELREIEDLTPLPDGQGQSYAPLAQAQKGPTNEGN